MGVHGPADIEEEQDFDGVSPFRAGLDVEPALTRCRIDGAVEVELVDGPVAGPLPEALERDLDRSRADFAGIVEVAEGALVPDLDGPLVSRAVLPDADAFGVVAIGAEGGCPGGADPLVAALMAALLLFQPLFQGFHELVEPAKRLDFRHLFGGQVAFGHLAKPVLGKIERLQNLRLGESLDSPERLGEGAVETVDMGFRFHHRRPREVVEAVDVIGDQPGVERGEEREVFPERNGDAVAPQRLEEGQEHQVRVRSMTMVTRIPRSVKAIP